MNVVVSADLCQSKNFMVARHIYLKTFAVLQANNLLERYLISHSVTSRQQALQQWKSSFGGRLSKVHVGVYCNSVDVCTVSIKWWDGKWQTINSTAIVSLSL